MKIFALFLSAVLALTSASDAYADTARPNVLFLLADDLGWGDLSCHGSTFIKTPNIDQLAKEGTDFHQFDTASPVCSPSRAAFMTGLFPARVGIHSAIGGLRANEEIDQVDWLDPKTVMLPRLLKNAGYATGHIGKWHLQSSQADDAPMPREYGVDEHALFNSTSHPNIEKTVEYDEIWDVAVDFLKRHRDKPFYLNVWIHETHLAHYPTEKSLAEFASLDERQRIYAAVARDADQGIGKILAALKDLGLDQNTLVVFSSDNGPENTHPTMKEMRGGYGGYYSLGETAGRKGRKRSLHEGGVSTPFIVRWPGHVPADRIDRVTSLSATDLLPTVCAAVGQKLTSDSAGDGENMLAAWLGQETARTKPIFWEWTGTDKPNTNWCRWAVRDADWKLVTDNADRFEVYKVSDDRAEQKNLAAMHSDIVRELQAKLEGWKASLPRESPANCLSEKRSKKPKAKAK